MSEHANGIPAEALALLDEHVPSFEHLEALLLFHREQLREWTADEVAESLAAPADLARVLEHLTQAQLIAVRAGEPAPVFFYDPATSDLADAVESLASAYRTNRAPIIRRMNSNVIARLRHRAARVFAESFVVTPAPRAEILPSDGERRPIGLFLDVDGTLLEFASRPELARVPPRVVALLARLHAILGGALALVSGRSIRQLDSLFAPLQLPCAGMHGAERRDSMGRVHEISPQLAVATKGDAVEAFLAEPAFAGKMPVFIGDDVTDLDAFAAVERHGGRAIAVGTRIDAQTRLPQPSAVIEWLEFLVRAEGRYA